MNLSNILRKNYINLRSWSTKQKIVVIESDDWGSIRMRNQEAYQYLLSKGIPVDKQYFTRNDTLEQDADMFRLLEVLSRVKDSNGCHPIITCNSIVANPDFEQVAASGFKEYHYMPVQNSYLENDGKSNQVLGVFKDCIKKSQFLRPQFHGREHLNVRKWLNNLAQELPYDVEGFRMKCLLGLVQGKQVYSTKFYQDQNYMAGFESLDSIHAKEIEIITEEGLRIFEATFGYKSKTFVAQSLIWGDHLNLILLNNGVRYIQGAQQFKPLGQGKLKVVNRFNGDRNEIGQILWRRNASFEPSANPKADWVDQCLEEIDISFKWNTPAIINSHRVNFMGGINPENRDSNLILLERLLKTIIKKWPSVQFMASDQLGDLMN